MSEVLTGTGSASAEMRKPSRLGTAQPRGGGLASTSMSVCSVLPRPCRVSEGGARGRRRVREG